MRAKELVRQFPSSSARDALLAIPDFIVDRDH
jgi:hypothetical protein